MRVNVVMAGRRPRHPRGRKANCRRIFCRGSAWMPGTSPGMTSVAEGRPSPTKNRPLSQAGGSKQKLTSALTGAAAAAAAAASAAAAAAPPGGGAMVTMVKFERSTGVKFAGNSIDLICTASLKFRPVRSTVIAVRDVVGGNQHVPRCAARCSANRRA